MCLYLYRKCSAASSREDRRAERGSHEARLCAGSENRGFPGATSANSSIQTGLGQVDPSCPCADSSATHSVSLDKQANKFGLRSWNKIKFLVREVGDILRNFCVQFETELCDSDFIKNHLWIKNDPVWTGLKLCTALMGKKWLNYWHIL